MQYKVTKQYGRGPASIGAEFATVEEARSYIENHLLEDAALNVKVIYRIVEWGDVVAEYDPSQEGVIPDVRDQGAQGGKESGLSFRPTPFNTAPRPSGSPHSWVKGSDEDKNKDK